MAVVIAAGDENPIQEVLSLPILLADRVLKSTQESNSLKPGNSDLARQVTQLSHLLRSVAHLTTTTAAIYDRPIRRVAIELNKTLERALSLVRKCRHKKTNVLRQVLSITTTADCRKVSTLLDSSLADVKWVLSIYSQNSDNGIFDLSLPPIASNDPTLAWVWSYIAAVQMGKTEAAHELANLALNNDRYKKIIAAENGIPPLLKLLKESGNIDAQNAAASALCNLVDDHERVSMIVKAGGVQVISKAMAEAGIRVPITLVNLISGMSEMDSNVQEEFGRENVTRLLVSLLGLDVNLEDIKEELNLQRSAENVNKKDAESSEVKLRLKVSCATALWKLAKGSLVNSKKITETKALLVLARLIEKERGDSQINCLLAVMELAAVAELNSELKRTAFKPNSPAAKAVLDQLLRVVCEKPSSPNLVGPAVKAIGCLQECFQQRRRE